MQHILIYHVKKYISVKYFNTYSKTKMILVIKKKKLIKDLRRNRFERV